MLLIKNGFIKPMVGEDIENGCVLIGDDGKITAVGDFDAMDGALRRLMSDGDLRVRLSAAGHAAAAQYDWRTLSSRLVDFYAEI